MPVLDGIGSTKAIRAVEASRRKRSRAISLHERPLSSVVDFDGNLPDDRRASEQSSGSPPQTSSDASSGSAERVKIFALTGLATEGDKKMG